MASSFSTHNRDDDAESTLTVNIVEPLPPASMEIKRVDHYFSRVSKEWHYKDMDSGVPAEGRSDDPWKDYGFVLVRTIPQEQGSQPTFKIVIKSRYILKACQDVIQTWPGVSWNADPLELEPNIFLTWHRGFIGYRNALVAQKAKTEEEMYVLTSVNSLLSFLAAEYRSTLAQIERLTAHGEITFDLLYGIFVPRSLVVTRCATTGLERLWELRSLELKHVGIQKPSIYRLVLEGIDLVNHRLKQTVGVGRVFTQMDISHFTGVERIDSLDVFPLLFHAAAGQLREAVARRADKWFNLVGVHHCQYSGIASRREDSKWFRLFHNEIVEKFSVRSRIIVDRATFQNMNPDYSLPLPLLDGRNTEKTDLSAEERLLTPTIVYGFSLADKMWLEFDLTRVMPVEWNEDAFANLVLQDDRKMLLRSLVEAHHERCGFDDFVKGKGGGLVVNLSGPPGVGKTFSAEATSEHLKRPLYVIGVGDLGTSAEDIEHKLGRIFDVATIWKAIVLIDEADVFLERRSMNELERNAMVAVFLRQVEYYSGILFLTTNRVQAFDQAFLSRIHIALHFDNLNEASRAQMWRAFMMRAGIAFDETQIALIAKREVNGRQIKNAVRTAHSLALGSHQAVSVSHIEQMLDTMAKFEATFERESLI
ncbi:P-loop containing nucleoside triphosphate hydrolase protein [Mycena olivaceomarginata]|nr:P-loop containing nucleoside triphosphate hydrolase protein [Mycena olivaceomarginata]